MAWSATLNDMRGAKPTWLPRSVLIYLAHEKYGLSMRQIARELNIQPSTVSRSLKRTSQKLMDPLFALGVRRVSSNLQIQNQKIHNLESLLQANKLCSHDGKRTAFLLSIDKLRQDSKRLLKALNAPNRYLLVSLELHKVAVVKFTTDGTCSKEECFDRSLAEVFILNNWIKLENHNKVLSYKLTSEARNYLEYCLNIIAKKKSYLRNNLQRGTAQRRHQRETPKTTIAHGHSVLPKKKTEEPILALARLRDKSGDLFLSAELVTAGRMLREDFELSNLISSIKIENSPRSQKKLNQLRKFDSLLDEEPQTRLERTLAFLGPDLSDVAVRCCCHMQGMEQIEKSLNWSARSGKIVLRIALMQLAHFYKLETRAEVPIFECETI